MQKIVVIILLVSSALMGSCEKDKTSDADEYGNGPRTSIPGSLQGNWMYGNFSMTEYWNQNPADYIGNAFEMAIAFRLNANGTYEHYFTSKTVSGGITTYHQSLTKGTVVVNEADKTITTHAKSAHYKQTKNGVTTENRDLSGNEITQTTKYTYDPQTTSNGTKTIYLKLNGTGNALQFLQKS
ncbi:MAG: hypothetical protein KF862_01415 [Chitinophagaceae bacterium]|nr:hypothetical protein [Chitinophagaceae bacterium]